MFEVKLYGGFDLLDDGGNSVCPTAQKDCALLALLGLSKNQRRPRKWLQAMLWSESGEQQGAASLRQSLSRLRKLFAPHEVILADRLNVTLDMDQIHFPEAAIEFQPRPGEGLLDGIDVSDPAFEEWLRSERRYKEVEQERSPQPEVETIDVTYSNLPTETVLVVEAASTGANDDRSSALAQALIDEIANAALMLGIRVMVARANDGSLSAVQPAAVELQTIHIAVNVNTVGGHGMVSLAAYDHFRSLLWSLRREVEMSRWMQMRQLTYSLGNEFLSFIIEREAKIASQDPRERDATAHAAVALLGIVRPHSVSIDRMSECAAKATSTSPHGLYRALHGTVEVFRYAERFGSSPELREQALDHFQVALNRDSGNPLVNALAGHAHSMFLKDVSRGLPLTQRSARLAPNSALCLAFYALSLSYAERPREAHRQALRALHLSGTSLIRAFAEGICSYTALICGRPELSIQMGSAALTLSPQFRPIITNVATASALTGNHVMARRGYEDLKKFDPAFSIQQVEAPEYPLLNSDHRSLVLEGMKTVGMPTH